MTSRRIGPPLLFTLGVLSMVSPLATDLYLPTLPRISEDLGASATQVQLSLTGFMIGMMVGQLGFGPLADRFGRRGPLLIGTVLFVCGSALAVFAPTIEVLVLARVIQGACGAAATVIARAVVTDLARGQEAARALNLLLVILGAAPIVAPLLGGVFAEALGWRGLLGIVLVLGVVMLVLAFFVVPETYPREMRLQAHTARQAGAAPLRELLTPRYLGFTLAFAGVFGAMMAYISGSPFVYQRMAGLTEMQYGLVLGSGAVCMVITTAVSARLNGTFSTASLAAVGVLSALVGTVGVLIIVLVNAPIILIAFPALLMAVGAGLVLGNASALALDGIPPAAAGTASAVLGAAQYGAAVITTPMAGLAGDTSATPMAIAMVVCAVLSAFGLVVGVRDMRKSAARPGVVVLAK